LVSPGKNPGQWSGSTASRIFLSPILFTALRLVFGGLFLYAGAMKLADTAGFSQTISAYRLLPDPLVPCAAMGLPAVEVVVGMGTLLNRRWAMLGMLGLMIIFLGVLTYGVAIGLDIDCGCLSAPDPAAGMEKPLSPPVDPGFSGGEELDDTFVLIDPVQEGDNEENTCSGDGGDPTRLRHALLRDIFLLFGVLYIVAWPDLRKRNRIGD